MIKMLILLGVAGFLLLLGFAFFCFYLARKAEDERQIAKKEEEDKKILETSLEELVDKELEERYRTMPAGQKKS